MPDKHRTDQSYDVLVVGGGAAGLSAGLVLGRARRRVAVVDAGSPRNAPATHMHGFLSRDGTPPAELLAVGRSELSRYGVVMIRDEVVGIAGVVPEMTVRLASSGTLTARRLLIATGAWDEIPDIPGAAERWGRDLLHCPYCHGWEVRDQALGVLGTHPGAVAHAQLIRQWSEDVIFFTNGEALTDTDGAALGANRIRVIGGEVAGLRIEDDRLNGVELIDGRTIARSAVFIRTVNRPVSAALLEDLGCAVDEGGFVSVDALGRTSVPGVWAAGNVVDPRAQVITSAGTGSTAAMAINADLVEEALALVEAGPTGTAAASRVARSHAWTEYEERSRTFR